MRAALDDTAPVARRHAEGRDLNESLAGAAPAVAVFAAGTALALAYSWRSLRHLRSHGVPRFFAFEGILIIGLLNRHAWFADPASPRQLLSWLLLVSSAALALHGYLLLRRFGRATPVAPDSPLHGFENTNALVATGAYRVLRHPLYASLLYLAWGAALKTASPASLGVAVVTSGFLWATGRIEEDECVARFGDAYRAYMRRTARFIPYLW